MHTIIKTETVRRHAEPPLSTKRNIIDGHFSPGHRLSECGQRFCEKFWLKTLARIRIECYVRWNSHHEQVRHELVVHEILKELIGMDFISNDSNYSNKQTSIRLRTSGLLLYDIWTNKRNDFSNFWTEVSSSVDILEIRFCTFAVSIRKLPAFPSQHHTLWCNGDEGAMSLCCAFTKRLL